jgi:hypothetical protein
VSLATLDLATEVVAKKQPTRRAAKWRPSQATQGFRFLQKNLVIVLVVSALVLIPCFWHRHIEAGDLGSHTYNAWLASLIEQGRVPGLYLAHQWNNIAVDYGLAFLGPRLGFTAAEKIVVSACVLTFFWGAFALIAASTQRIPWMVAPAIAIIAYGFTFYSGFMNFYLSMGLAFLAAAVTWRGTLVDWILGAIFGALTLVAHPMGFGLLIALVAYIQLAEIVPNRHRPWLFVGALCFIVAVHFALPHFFRVSGGLGWKFEAMNGADQMLLFRPVYKYLALAAFAFGSFAFVASAFADRHRHELAGRVRTPLELWAILLFAAVMVPGAILLPEYTAAVSAISSRLTTLTAIVGLCVLGAVPFRKWILGGLSVIALMFFAMQYHDTAVLNGMEQRVETLVAGLPYGSKVSYTVDFGDYSRVNWRHLIDRACIGQCFTYSNYEPGSKQFRVRLSPEGSSIVSRSGFELEHGSYVVRAEDLPLYQIYQPDEADLTKLAIRSLAVGEKNGRIGHPQPIY